ncbi:MAG: response regulator transcription factor [Mangrovibacterium sp.]
MEENLFIIHSSAIVRTGLTSILQEFFKFEITQLHNPSELQPFCQIEGRILLILIQDGIKLSPSLEKQIKANNQVFLLAISADTNHPTITGYYDSQISLDADNLQIQQIIQLARKSVVRQKPASTVQSEDLTQREIDVLKKIAIGLPNKEIAESLNISIHTVISHRKNITEKLNIKSISGLTVYAIMNKLLDISEINPNELV